MTKTTASRANAALWTVQLLLGALFLFGGGFKLVVPIAVIAKQMPVVLPGAFIRLIGVLELTGGLGLVLPGLLRLHRALTPLAAGGLVLIMCGAIGVTITTGPFNLAAFPFAVGLLAAVVAYGRARIVPLSGTSRSAHAPRAATVRPLARTAA